MNDFDRIAPTSAVRTKRAATFGHPPVQSGHGRFFTTKLRRLARESVRLSLCTPRVRGQNVPAVFFHSSAVSQARKSRHCRRNCSEQCKNYMFPSLVTHFFRFSFAILIARTFFKILRKVALSAALSVDLAIAETLLMKFSESNFYFAAAGDVCDLDFAARVRLFEE
jgi:hypothetical protein